MMFGNTKYNWLLALVLIGTPYIIIVFVTLGVDVIFQMIFWMIYVCVLVVSFVTVPQYEYRKHQEPCDGSLFMIGPLIYMNHTSADMLLGYEKQVEEVKIDWDNQQLKILESSTIYQRSVQTVARNVSKDFRGQTQLYRSIKPVDKIMRGIKIDSSLSPKEQLAQAAALLYREDLVIAPDIYADKINEQITSNQEKEIEKATNEAIQSREELLAQFAGAESNPDDLDHNPEDLDQNNNEDLNDNEALREPTPEEIQAAREEYIREAAEQNPLVVQPTNENQKGEIVSGPRMPSFEDIGLPSEAQRQLLKDSFIYLVHLYHPEVLEGYEFLEFEQAFFIMPGPIQEVLATRKMKVEDHEGYPVNVQGCSVLMCCLGFVIGRIPMILVYASENLLKYQNEESRKANQIQYSAIHFATKKILEDIIYKLLSEQDPFQKRIEAAETKSSALLDYIDYLIQDIKADRYIRASPDLQRANQELESELARAKIWKPVTIILAIILCIMLFAMVFILAPATTSSSVNKAPKKSSLVDLYYIISFLKYFFIIFI